jgi:hypothetical protein
MKLLMMDTMVSETVKTEQGWRKQPTQHHTVTRDCMCSNMKLLMMEKWRNTSFSPKARDMSPENLT